MGKTIIANVKVVSQPGELFNLYKVRFDCTAPETRIGVIIDSQAMWI